MVHDIFDQVILCSDCHSQTHPHTVLQDGFTIRALQCPQCHKLITHPGDVKDYEHYLALRNRQFHVKLRMVGNSFCVSIPRELITFNRLEHDIDKLVRLMLQEPNKIIIDFTTHVDKDPELIG